MASNRGPHGWRVRINDLPGTITRSELAQRLGLPESHFFVPPSKAGSVKYAWIDGFADEADAREFARQWSGASILNHIIKCVAKSPNDNEAGGRNASSQPSATPLMRPQPLLASQEIPCESNSSHALRSPQPLSSTSHYSRRNSKPSEPRLPTPMGTRKRADSSSKTNALKTNDGEDKRALCRFANKGNCRQTSNECKYRHQRCNDYESCSNSNCKLAHASPGPVSKPSPTTSAIEGASCVLKGFKLEPRENRPYRPRSDSASSTSSFQSVSTTQSVNVEGKQCSHGAKCFNADCNFDHPDGWNPCLEGIKCDDFDCTANHPYKRKAKCRDGPNCKDSDCKFLHPDTRPKKCFHRANCRKWDCPKLHPRSRARPCPDREKCTILDCPCLHPPERTKLVCTLGADCRDVSCQLQHPLERPPKCEQPDTCSNFHCTRLHEPDWNPCEAGDDCKDEHCPKLHSPARQVRLHEKTASTVTANDKAAKKKMLKSLEQRRRDRQKAELPILSCQDEFCERLEREHLLVVTAETGSGKSTQLPQYAAERFGSLVICTQPRVVAALSLARRVSEEYDGKSVGESVGYQVGNANRVGGTEIMFMTDAALIRERQRDEMLKHVRVLIIDEAHERSLNTDIVLGIAKMLLAERPDDFYVVIASATIDPTRFLQFFDRPSSTPLVVKGRVFPVTTTEKPPPENCSDQKQIDLHTIPTILELYPNHQGHTLVFLPGQGEIEKALRIFKSKLPDDCIALPLYGSQSPEDQEKVIKFNEKNKRMVVFCTNVAETSLTIPNVRLVIDSGWAKEARYDVKRRLTVIETVRISRSSADQRKGRAGRTAPGHCVRLYNDAELKRLNIEPEILRSSLDLVLLQLIRLDLDPKMFPFMDQPKEDVISSSLQLLTTLKCVENQKVTARGKLFTELGLDPRLSAFVVEIYSEYKSLLECVAVMVAILSAPGTIFFMGGSTQEAKQERKEEIALQAGNYKSDLFHLYSVYEGWKNARGKEVQGKCSQCNKIIRHCPCRIKHSNEQKLNNKVLQTIDASSALLIKQITNARWLESDDKMPEMPLNIIGVHLAQIFPEQCGYLLVPQLPSEGVRLVASDIRASIANTSVFMQKLHTHADREIYQHFVAMTITQLPSGNYIIERLHPIPRSVAAVQSTIQNLLSVENVGSELAYSLRQQLKTYESQPWAKWLVYQYDRLQCRFSVWGLEVDRASITQAVRSVHDKTVQKLCQMHDLLECGPIKADFQGGLICTHINQMTNALRLDLQNVPAQTSTELRDWLKKIIGVEWHEIREHRFYTPHIDTKNRNKNEARKKHVYLIFKNEEVFRRAANKVPPYHLGEQENDSGNRRDHEKETWGRELIIETPASVTVQDIINRYGATVVVNCTQLNKQKEKLRAEASLKLDNLPVTSDEAFLRQCLQEKHGPVPKRIHVARASNNLTAWAIITFNDKEECNRASLFYNLRLCQNRFPIIIMGKTGPKTKYVTTTVTQQDDNAQAQAPSQRKNCFSITVISREVALQIFSLGANANLSSTTASSLANLDDASHWNVDGSARVTVLRTDLYPSFEETVDRICEQFGVQAKYKEIPNFGRRYTFSHGSPQKTSLAASMMAQTFAPMNIKLRTDRQKRLFSELEEVGKIKTWERELSLAVNKNKTNTNIEIRGPQILQGQLMRRIADYSDQFDQRYREHQLSATVAPFFGRQKAAAVKLQQIASGWSSKSCLVSFSPKTSTITIVGKANAALTDVNACENEVIQLLDETIANAADEGTDDDDAEEENEADDAEDIDSSKTTVMRQERRCVFCQRQSSVSINFFRICGHGYCQCAAQALTSSNTLPLQCKDCHMNIHIRDIQSIFSNDEQSLMHLVKISIQNYLTQNAREDDRVFCPNEECEGLIKLSSGYQTCLTCGQNVCPHCQVIDDELHQGRTCAQLVEEKKKGEFLPQLFAAARKFVEENWPLEQSMRPIGRIDENPFLEKRYRSLTRFYKGIEALGHSFPPDLSKGFFAYHGSPSQAIVPICQDGFDPKRRAGQAYGPGEYFGVTASISHGYSQRGGRQAGFTQMIIAFLLRCTQLKTVPNFCYVVNNPTDWTYAYNLPVLVVTYGNSSANQLSQFPNQISNYVADETVWNAPFRWHWQQDNRQFEPFTDNVNKMIEEFYERWKLHGGSAEVVTPPITRYVDDLPQTYKINFRNNRQMNTRTLYQRLIDRRPMNIPTGGRKWSYLDDHGQWVVYESLVQDTIEQAFEKYRNGRGPSTVDIHFPGRPETYQIHFLMGEQTNNVTNLIRKVKRE